MRLWTTMMLSACLAAGTPANATKNGDPGHETLPPNDGWAALDTGTTGGSNADADHVYVVTNRQELLAALANRSPTPKILYVDGTIDVNVDNDNRPLACEDYHRNGYTLEAYLEAYDPATWGRVLPSGPLEAARVASQLAQQERVRIRIGSNTTIAGVDKKARIRGVWFDIRDATNIIIRNLNFEDTYDCFPQWNPTDGSQGNWNSQYDSISLRNGTHFWIDHNEFADVTTADQDRPVYFGRLFRVHDGQLDITNAADLVTVSWNRLRDHDKVMLIGSSDSATADRGKLRVTLHHNQFDNVGQRAPRVRFGQVHVYNNLYETRKLPTFGYRWGVGIESRIYAENNFFRNDASVAPESIITRFNGTAIHESGTLLDGASDKHFFDVRAAYNAANDPDLGPDVGWVPTLVTEVDETRRVLPSVLGHAGPFNW